MQHNSTFNKQLRKKITARVVMKKRIKMLEADIDENNAKIFDLDREIKRIKKVISKRKQKNRNYIDLSLRLIEIKNSETVIRNEINATKQIN